MRKLQLGVYEIACIVLFGRCYMSVVSWYALIHKATLKRITKLFKTPGSVMFVLSFLMTILTIAYVGFVLFSMYLISKIPVINEWLNAESAKATLMKAGGTVAKLAVFGILLAFVIMMIVMKQYVYMKEQIEEELAHYSKTRLIRERLGAAPKQKSSILSYIIFILTMQGFIAIAFYIIAQAIVGMVG